MSNCREYCPHRELCKKHFPDFQGSDEKYFHFECPMYDKFEDARMEAKDIMEEQLPFMDDYEGPEDDELP